MGEVYHFKESPLSAFGVCFKRYTDQIKKECPKNIYEAVSDAKRAVTKMYTWKVIVGRHGRGEDYNQEFLNILLHNEKLFLHDATSKMTNKDEIDDKIRMMETKFCKFSSTLIDAEPLDNKIISILGAILSPEVMKELEKDKRFLADPLPESHSKVSTALGIKEDRVMNGTLKSNVFTNGRLLRSFGNNFLDDKPSKHTCILLPVTGSLFNFMSNRKDTEALPFAYVWVDDKEWDATKGPYDKKYRKGTKYYVQVRLTDFMPRFKDAVAEVLERGGKDDDMI